MKSNDLSLKATPTLTFCTYTMSTGYLANYLTFHFFVSIKKCLGLYKTRLYIFTIQIMQLKWMFTFLAQKQKNI